MADEEEKMREELKNIFQLIFIAFFSKHSDPECSNDVREHVKRSDEYQHLS